MKNLFLITILFVNIIYSQSQGENDNWHFGNNNAIKFSSPQTIIGNSQIDSIESTGSVSDNEGNLLFYTNGTTVWNSQNQIMLNGTGLLGNESSSQLVIAPHPGNSDLYYIITSKATKDKEEGGNYNFSIVDMSLNNGLGEVILKNSPLRDQSQNFVGYGHQSAEAITIVSNISSQEYYVLIPNAKTLYTFIINVNGINPIANTESDLADPFIVGIIKASADGSQIALCSFQNFINIYSFDVTSALIGSLNYSFVPPAGDRAYSVEFSPSGNLIYMCSITFTNIPNRLYVINPANNSHQSLQTPLGIIIKGGLQRNDNTAKHLEIYLTTNNGLFRISNADDYTTCAIDPSSFTLTGTSSTYVVGLPQSIPQNFSNTCIPNLVVTTDINAPNIDSKQAQNTITALNTIYDGSTAIYHAGVFITLTDGFHAANGSRFRGYIDGCSGLYIGKTDNINSTKEDSKITFDLNNKIAVYPNPAKSIVTIITKDYLISKVTINSTDGKEIFTKNVDFNKSYEIDVSSLSNGIYILSIVTIGGERFTEKLIKN